LKTKKGTYLLCYNVSVGYSGAWAVDGTWFSYLEKMLAYSRDSCYSAWCSRNWSTIRTHMMSTLWRIYSWASRTCSVLWKWCRIFVSVMRRNPDF